MSLVNLSHVCSHLQNASLARLGLTSIPYTKLHLSLSLLLHKQGFLSAVHLGGPQPPAACFPAPVADNHRITSAPHRDRDPRSGEAALYEVVVNRRRVEELAAEGYGVEALEFAREHRELTAEQLVKDGWDSAALDFVLEHGQKDAQQLEEEGFDDTARTIIQEASLPDAIAAVRAQLREQGLPADRISQLQLEPRLRSHLRRQGFSRSTLAYFAGPARFTTPHHLERDGITLTTPMGAEVSSQPLTLLPPAFQDPDALESSQLITRANRASRRLWLGLKYGADGRAVLSKARMVSKPTKRLWLDTHELGKVVRGSNAREVRGLGRVGEVMVVSTDRGVMDARECVERRVGGMPLCRVW